MFIVAMTIAVITAMGVYALNIASMEVRTAGFVRQQVQTQYLSNYGSTAASQAVTGTNAQMYDTIIMSPTLRDTACVSLYGTPTTASAQALACHRAGSAELAVEMNTGGAALLTPWTSAGTSALRGSVGLPLQADFFVEVTDPNQRQPPPGYAVNSNLCFIQFTASSYGLTPTGAASAGTLAGYQSEGFEMSRARILGGPVTCTGTN